MGNMRGMHLTALLTYNMGIVTRRMMRDAGVSDHRLRLWLKSGVLIPLNRSLVALPSADPTLVAVARAGGRLACVSAAKLREIWVVDDGCLHLSFRANKSHFSPPGPGVATRRHWDSKPLDPHGDIPALESGRSMLAHIASCQPLDLAVAAFDSAVRKGLITLEELQVLASVLNGRFARVVSFVSTQADSGLESVTRVRLALAGVACREQVWIDGHPVDLLIGDRLIIQLDGKQHLKDEAQLARDRRQDRRLRLMGYTVLRYGYADVIHRWEATFAEICAHLAAQNAR